MRGLRETSILLAALWVISRPVFAMPINGDVAFTLAEGQWLSRQQVRLSRMRSDKQNLGREMEILAIPLVLGYGLTAKNSAFLEVPYVRKSMRQADGSWREAQGLGDGTLIFKRLIRQQDSKAHTRRAAVYAGRTIAFGRDRATDAIGRLPQTIQPASGAVDWIGGWVWTDQSLDREWDLEAAYKFRGSANDFEFGDVLTYNISYQKRISPAVIPDAGVYTQLNAVLEFSGSISEWNRNGGAGDADSGGHLLFASPGVQWVSETVVWETSAQIPVIRRLNGRQIEPKWNFGISVRQTW